MSSIKHHWENVYETKKDDEVSWYQENPTSSLNLITALNLNKDAVIIDIGGGNSNLTRALQKQGFFNLSVLDISKKALEKTKTKLGDNGSIVKWIVSNVLEVKLKQKYDLWHDRATFHFLTQKSDIVKYVNIVNSAIKNNGYLVLATFSKSGPKKCSGLDIMQYDKEKLQELFGKQFKLVKSFEEVHRTPYNTEQNFIYNLFQKIKKMPAISLESIITCPKCGHKKEEEMPTDSCQFLYECENCKTVLKPNKGDCCVYCSYGTMPCPPIQENKSCGDSSIVKK